MKILMWEAFAPGAPFRVGGHHYAERFLRRGDEVAWCVGPVSPVNVIKSDDETRRRLGLWRRGGDWVVPGRMFAYAPLTLLPHRPYPFFESGWVHRRTLRATVPRFRNVLARAGFAPVDLLWMSTGSPFLALLDEIPHARTIYRMSDDAAAFPDAPRTFAALETEILRRADLVLATASDLAARARGRGARRVLYLPNACDPEPFLRAAGAAEPDELSDLPRPRAVYAGALDSWFDARLVAEVAGRLPDWSFVLIGPPRADLSALRGSRNVRLLGARPWSAIPAYFAAADAGIVPFALDDLTHAIHPLKVYEYCAAGLPVVATPMRETAAMGAPLRLAATAGEFAAALVEARAETRTGGVGAREARAAWARRNTWDMRFETLAAEIDALSGDGVGRDAAGPRAGVAGLRAAGGTR